LALHIRYFAALRDRMGIHEEAIEASQERSTGTALIAWLQSRDQSADALAHPSVRLIINDEIAPKSTTLNDGDTIAFCPPFSGG
jgi:molybdopterin synthase sulfur carrier subunit